MNLIRKLKISSITTVEFSELENEIIFYIEEKLKDLTTFKMKGFPNTIYYMNKEGEWVLEQDNIHDILCVNLDHYTSIFYQKHKLKRKHTKFILKYFIEKILKIKINILDFDGRSNYQAEEIFKKKFLK